MTLRKGVTYDATGKIVSCLFCRICDLKEPGTIVLSNDIFVAFKTIAPVTHNHILVSPREHIQNINSLAGPEGASLIEEMVEFGRKSLGKDADNAQYSFHVPPFNSIDHLHLHCIANPEQMSWTGWMKYCPGSMWCITAESLIANLRGQDTSDGNAVK
mmetsp:Transcript_22942/g.33544  ORF Transcript_22942/g.33544 Transcript_22942/m.33544 type:complete len:158 (+) Transcript_22942:133-606(+)